MSELRKRILAGGITVICAVMLMQDETHLGALVAWCGLWVMGGWLFPTWAAIRLWSWRRWFARLLIGVLVYGGIVAGSHMAANRWLHDPERITLKSEHAAAIEGAAAVRWYILPAEDLYREVIALRAWNERVRRDVNSLEFFQKFPGPGGSSAWDSHNAEKLKKFINEADETLPKPFDIGLRKPGNVGAEPSFENVVQSYRWSQRLQR